MNIIVKWVLIVLGIVSTLVFLKMAIKINNIGALLLVSGFALICFGLVPASRWFDMIGPINPQRQIKKAPPHCVTRPTSSLSPHPKSRGRGGE
jgi:hypothetical protein